MAKTGKTTGSGHPIHTNTTVPSKPHGQPAHVDMQSFNSKGKASVEKAGAHKTDPGLVDWGSQAHPSKGGK